MTALFFYSLKVSLCLGCIYLFYHLALRNLTFYNWNRWYLLLGSIACCAIPGLAALSWFESSQVQYVPVIKIIPRLYAFSATAPSMATDTGFFDIFLNIWLPVLFICGILVQGTRLGIQFWSFYRLRQHAKRLPGYSGKIYQVDQNIVPFSFGQSIFLNTNLLPSSELPEVIRHELVHVQQAHTVDIIWMELVCILNWYNPFAWLMRQHLRQNLEFIADNQVLQSGTDKTHYQYLLLQVIGQPDFSLANQFNFSPLKNRIMMMNKMPSAKHHLAKFLLFVPLSAGLLFACREVRGQVAQSETKNLLTFKGEGQNLIVAEFQDGTQEKFDISTEAGKKAFIQAQKFLGDSYNPANYDRKWPEEFKILLEGNPQIAQIKWRYDMDQLSKNDFAFPADRLYITLKSGAEEVYQIENKVDLTRVENKLGKLPLLPPPPPTINFAN